MVKTIQRYAPTTEPKDFERDIEAELAIFFIS